MSAKLFCDKCGDRTTAGLTPGRLAGGQHLRVNQRGRGVSCGTWREVASPAADTPESVAEKCRLARLVADAFAAGAWGRP